MKSLTIHPNGTIDFIFPDTETRDEFLTRLSGSVTAEAARNIRSGPHPSGVGHKITLKLHSITAPLNIDISPASPIQRRASGGPGGLPFREPRPLPAGQGLPQHFAPPVVGAPATQVVPPVQVPVIPPARDNPTGETFDGGPSKATVPAPPVHHADTFRTPTGPAGATHGEQVTKPVDATTGLAPGGTAAAPGAPAKAPEAPKQPEAPAKAPEPPKQPEPVKEAPKPAPAKIAEPAKKPEVSKTEDKPGKTEK